MRPSHSNVHISINGTTHAEVNAADVQPAEGGADDLIADACVSRPDSGQVANTRYG